MDTCAQCHKRLVQSDLKRCSKCKKATYCSKECQIAHWKTHKLSCSKPSAQIVAIEVINEYERGNGGSFRTVEISPNHPVFSSAGEVCPIPTAIGIPLRVYRHPIKGPANNAMALWLRVEMHNLFAPMDWQLDLSTVTVARQDHKPLTPQVVEALSEFNRRVCTAYEFMTEGIGGDYMEMIKKTVFEDFCREFSKKKAEQGDTSFNKFAWWANLGQGYQSPDDM
ncbi:MYND finger protein [Rhizoctonia solani AG-3 Rhs1AP]|uniref:MYND finger protein n=1 Tax=Rhizoctonia solani AG-3 Rhs1AP TaxID=1086054 RepID=X8J0J6_9AGAM|nr:MYND finger protein [Rhizoctonia solani AG-3 Rhs1AP]